MKATINNMAMVMILAAGLSIPTTLTAQYRPVRSSVQVQVYKTYPRQIYYPEYNCYYDIQTRNYIYPDRGRWIVSVNLPFQLRRLSFGHTPFVELNIAGFTPERYNAGHRERYRYYQNDNYYNQRYSENRREERREWRENERDNRRENKGWKHERHEDRD